MNSVTTPGEMPRIAFPRYFRFGRYWVNSYKVLMCVGFEVGILTSAWLAEREGISPLRMGLGALGFALAGMLGARLYHLMLHAAHYRKVTSWKELWNTREGGWGVQGALLTVVPLSFVFAALLNIPTGRFWDFLGGGIVTGGFWIRMGCVFNGCCAGRETKSPLGVCLHDTRWVRKRRIPVQFMEMGWWLLGIVGFFWLWPRHFAPGTYALGVLGWYGLGRFWLEPLRESSDLVGRVRINQVIAAALVLVGGGGILLKTWWS